MRSAPGHRLPVALRLPECRSAPDRPARRWFGCLQPGLAREASPRQSCLLPAGAPLPRASPSSACGAVAPGRVWVARVQEELARGGHVFSASAWNGCQLRGVALAPGAGKAEPFRCHASCAPHGSHCIAPPYIVSLYIAPPHAAPQRGEGSMQVCLPGIAALPPWRGGYRVFCNDLPEPAGAGTALATCVMRSGAPSWQEPSGTPLHRREAGCQEAGFPEIVACGEAQSFAKGRMVTGGRTQALA